MEPDDQLVYSLRWRTEAGDNQILWKLKASSFTHTTSKQVQVQDS